MTQFQIILALTGTLVPLAFGLMVGSLLARMRHKAALAEKGGGPLTPDEIGSLRNSVDFLASQLEHHSQCIKDLGEQTEYSTRDLSQLRTSLENLAQAAKGRVVQFPVPEDENLDEPAALTARPPTTRGPDRRKATPATGEPPADKPSAPAPATIEVKCDDLTIDLEAIERFVRQIDENHVAMVRPDRRSGSDSAGNEANERRKSDQRSSTRFQLAAQCRVAPCAGDELPESVRFLSASCLDISTGGMSFVIPRWPNASSVVISLGHPPNVTSIRANVVSQKEVQLDGRRQFRIGCRFVGRVEPFEEFR